MVDLWPEIITTEKIKAPVAILREQASLLGQKTKNLVTAEVEKPRKYNERFNYSFELVAPTLDNYHYRLFTVEHDISLYPLHLYIDQDIAEELKNQTSLDFDEEGTPFVSAENEDELMKQLRIVFSSKRTMHLVKALLAQAEPASQLRTPPIDIPSDDIPF